MTLTQGTLRNRRYSQMHTRQYQENKAKLEAEQCMRQAIMWAVIETAKAAIIAKREADYPEKKCQTGTSSAKIGLPSTKTTCIWLEKSRQISATVQLWNRGKNIFAQLRYQLSMSNHITCSCGIVVTRVVGIVVVVCIVYKFFSSLLCKLYYRPQFWF